MPTIETYLRSLSIKRLRRFRRVVKIRMDAKYGADSVIYRSAQTDARRSLLTAFDCAARELSVRYASEAAELDTMGLGIGYDMDAVDRKVAETIATARLIDDACDAQDVFPADELEAYADSLRTPEIDSNPFMSPEMIAFLNGDSDDV